jgi:methylmalonyl-CoA mutase C-terminal domain/subunit
MEVIYTGLKRSPEAIVQAALQEDVDVVGLSILSGAHEPLSRKIVEGLRAAGGESIRVAVGGTIPQQDVPNLRAAGVWEVFPMGTPLPAIIKAFERLQRED